MGITGTKESRKCTYDGTPTTNQFAAGTRRTNRRLTHHLSEFPFPDLPEDMQMVVLQHLDHPLDLLSLRQTCSRMRVLADTESLWQNLFVKLFPFTSPEQQAAATKAVFIQVYSTQEFRFGEWLLAIDCGALSIMNIANQEGIILQFSLDSSDGTYRMKSMTHQGECQGCESVFVEDREKWWPDRKPECLRKQLLSRTWLDSLPLFPRTYQYGAFQFQVGGTTPDGTVADEDQLRISSELCVSELCLTASSNGWIHFKRNGGLTKTIYSAFDFNENG